MTCRFIARGKNAGEVWIYGAVGDDWGGVTDKQFVKSLNDLGKVDTLTVRINSEGGSVIDGYAIYNALVRHPAYVDVQVDAFAGSIASIIAMAGDSISMAANSMMMIHNPSALAWGTSADMRKMADVLDGFRGQLLDTYAARTKKDAGTISEWMDAETWLTPAEAVQHGFADQVTQELKIAAMVNRGAYKGIPKEFKNRVAKDPRPSRDFMAVRLREFDQQIKRFRDTSH